MSPWRSVWMVVVDSRGRIWLSGSGNVDCVCSIYGGSRETQTDQARYPLLTFSVLDESGGDGVEDMTAFDGGEREMGNGEKG